MEREARKDGGRLRQQDRYPTVSVKGREVYAHQCVAERALGRPLPAGAEVHHANEDRSDFRNANLVICQDKAYHKLLHVRLRTLKAGGNPATELLCCTCKKPRPFSEFVVNRADVAYGLGRQCVSCRKAFTKSYVRKAKRGQPA